MSSSNSSTMAALRDMVGLCEIPTTNMSRPLSSAQERKLVAFLDDQFMELTRGYKKRSQPTTHLPTLSLYLDAARQILSLILQIPPLDPSTSLRTALLLRLTSDTLNSITGYPALPESLPEALDWLDDLDQAWLAVLKAQIWDPIEAKGVDLIIDAADASEGMKSSPVSQTERTRLRSLMLGSSASLEDWLYNHDDDEDVESMLERLGLQADFDGLFSRTLDYLSVEYPLT